ncbi:MAG TPA: methyltransferase domain-containing protein [Bacillota bacterium]|jgi:2-polyprenyl-3-methyl-5-hydroxy-6-metoxy-1,4-benzoquinol methylase|nr:methyltransferase domain-containing protein [Bacillota bacterium]HQJ36370.1 methyltransferase domain-containing protein [Bacillota bacterium]
MLSDRFKYDGREEISLNKIQTEARDLILEEILHKRYSFENITCVCSSNEAEVLSEKDRYGLPVTTVICSKCGLIFLNPRFRAIDYDNFYKHHYRKLHLGKRQPDYDIYHFQEQRGQKIFKFLQSYQINKGSLLEIGCSSGGILSVFKSNGWDITGIDLDSDYTDYGIRKGLNLKNCHSEDLLEEYSGRFDVIILSHVLEHFLDIKKELGIVYRLLKPQGYLYIEVPGIEHILNEEGWIQNDFLKILQIQHTYYFNLNTLCQVVESNGFNMIAGNEVINALFKKSSQAQSHTFRNCYRSNKDFLINQEINLQLHSKKTIDADNPGSEEKPAKQKAVLFGASKLGEIAVMALENQYEIACIFDNDRNKWGKELRNVKILPPYEIVNYKDIKIIITSSYREEISAQLNDMGVKDYSFFKTAIDNGTDQVSEFHQSISRILMNDPNFQMMYDTRSLVTKQYRNKKFNRMDICVRYLAIEEFHGKNNHGFELYSKMQKHRNQESHDLDQFIKLIQNIEQYGFDSNSSIIIDEKLRLIDGSHRLTCALYYGISHVPVKFVQSDLDIDYSLNWFIENGFSENEIALIDNKAKEIFEKWNLYFPIILWSPVKKFYSDITKELEEEYRVISVKDYQFENDYELFAIIKGIYAIDNIEQWKIEKKIQFMKDYDKCIRVIMVDLGDPDFRVKEINKMPISQEVERIKDKYRKKYSSRIDNYYHDVIIHIGDNYLHSKHVLQVLSKDIDIKKFLCNIKGYNYVLTKTDVPYMPDNFPEDYPLSKDVDLISSCEDFQDICKEAEEFADKYSSSYQIKKIKENGRLRIRFELCNFLCYQIDISCKIPCFSDTELIEALKRRKECAGYYKFDEIDEVVLREYEYRKDPSKAHHLEYIQKYEQKRLTGESKKSYAAKE